MHARFLGRVGAAIVFSLSLSCGGDDGGDTATPDGGAATPPDSGSLAHADGGADASTGGCSGLSYSSFGASFITKYCNSCHAGTVKGDDRQGAPDAYVFDTLAMIRTHAADMKMDVVVTKVMPFGATTLKPSDAERVQFGEWLSCGAPE